MIPEALFSLKGRRALVTGSSRGIGQATALLLGQAGAHVIFHASHPSPKLDHALAEARQQGISCEALTADLGDSTQVQALLEQAGAVDLLILNASTQTYMTAESFTEQEFEREYAVNVRSCFQLIQGVLPGMKTRGFGRIVTLGSVNQFRPAARLCLYGSTKGALANLTRSLAKSQGPYGITANNVVPGVIATDRNKEALANPETVQKLLDIIPIKRFGTAQDCAGTILLLCSPAGSYINGAEITVDGGMNL